MVTHPHSGAPDPKNTNDPAAQPIPYVLIKGPAWGIQLLNGRLYRDEHAHLQDPGGIQPTVWFAEDAADIQRQLLEVLLEEWYGVDPLTAALRVVRLEMGADGVWRVPPPDGTQYGYRPVDPDTGKPAEISCVSTAPLDVDQARAVMRQHRACAGEMPCRVRGRARALLARAGVMKLNRRASAWQGLALPEMAG